MQQDNGSFFPPKSISYVFLGCTYLCAKIWTNSLCITLNAKDWPSVISCRLLTERYAALIKFCAALIKVSDNQHFHFSQSSMIFIFWLHCWSNRECIYYIYHLSALSHLCNCLSGSLCCCTILFALDTPTEKIHVAMKIKWKFGTDC